MDGNTYHVTMVLLFFLVFELDIPYADDVFLRKYIWGDRARDGESVWDSGWVTVVMPQTKASASGAQQLEMLSVLPLVHTQSMEFMTTLFICILKYCALTPS